MERGLPVRKAVLLIELGGQDARAPSEEAIFLAFWDSLRRLAGKARAPSSRLPAGMPALQKPLSSFTTCNISSD